MFFTRKNQELKTPGAGPSDTGKTPFFQAKLTVNAPGDEHEKEADETADRVMRMEQNAAPIQRSPLHAQGCSCPACSGGTADIQRQEEGEEDAVPDMPASDEGQEDTETAAADTQDSAEQEEEQAPEPIQTKPATPGGAQGGHTAPPQMASELSAAKGGGSALPESTKSAMENHLGADFSNVRIHADQKAAELNDSVQARAFTHGQDIYFNQGQYAPETDSGKHLLAHELTHVVQQGGQQIIRRSLWGKIKSGVKKAAGWVGDKVKKGAKAVASGAKWLGGKVASGAKWLGGKVASGAKWLGGKVWKGAKWLGEKIWAGLKWAGAKGWAAMKWIGNYLYKVGESAVGFLVTLVTEFPQRFLRLLEHIGEGLLSFPGWLWEGVVLLFRGNFSGFGKWLWEGLKSGTAWALRLIAKVLDLFAVGELLDVLFNIIKFNTRKLTSTEEAEARKVFGNSIALWRVRVDEYSLIATLGNFFSNLMNGTKGGHMGVTTFHTVNFNRPINAGPCDSDMGWLIHELTHVSQMEHAGMQYLGEALHAQFTTGYYNASNKPSLAGKHLKDFNREWQAQIISDAYMYVLCAKNPPADAADNHRMISELQSGNL